MKNYLFRRWRFKGVGLLELGLGLGVLGLALIGSVRELNYQAADVKAQAAAGDLAQAATAAQEYLRVFRAELLEATTVGGNALGIRIARRFPNTTIPLGPPEAPNLPSVQGGGFLPPTYVDQNPYQSYHVLLVRQPVAGTLEGIVAAQWGQVVPDRGLTRIMSRLGPPGGAMLNRPSAGDIGKIQGTGGAWEILTSQRPLWAYNSDAFMQARRPVYNLGMVKQVPLEDYIYRNNIGIPEANTMRTALNMGGQNINNAATVNANTMNLQNGGEACAGDVTGCTFWISNEGGFRDNNNGWIQFIGNFGDNSDPGVERGLYVGGGPGNNLFVEGSSRVRGDLATAGTAFLYSDVNIGGDLSVLGRGRFLDRIGVMADPDDVPAGWRGGVRTVDLVATGTVATSYPVAQALTASLSWNGDARAARDGWFGRNIRTGGGIATNGYDPGQLPPGSPGGVRTWDVVASWGAYAMNPDASAPVAGMTRAGENFGKLLTTSYAYTGDLCAEHGQIARAFGSGNMLWCQGGSWRDISRPKMGRIIDTNGWTIYCEAGHTGEAFHAPVYRRRRYGPVTRTEKDDPSAVIPQCVSN